MVACNRLLAWRRERSDVQRHYLLRNVSLSRRLTPNIPATAYAADPYALAIAKAVQELVAARDQWLNPSELVKRVPEVVASFPDRFVPKDVEAAAVLSKRTLTALYNQRGKPEGVWLDGLHHALDEAVAAAYGWPVDLTDEEVLTR